MERNLFSIKLLRLIVRACYVLLAIAVVVFLMLVLGIGFEKGFFNLIQIYGKYLIVPFYLVVPEGYAALICLDRLLGNVLNRKIFDRQNVKLLNRVAVCCYIAAGIGIISFAVIAAVCYPFETLFVLPLGELFMGLVVSVVKSVFEAAIELKEENDLTI